MYYVDYTKKGYESIYAARKRAYILAQTWSEVRIWIKWGKSDRVGEIIETVFLKDPKFKPYVKFAEHKRAYFWLEPSGHLYRLSTGERYDKY